MSASRVLDRWWQQLDHFLFAPAEVATIRVFRVALALMLAWTFWPHRLELARELRGKALLPDLYDHVFLTTPYHLLIAALLLIFAVGYRTRIVGFLLVFLLLPLDFLVVLQQSRQVMLFALLAFSFLPSDAHWAVPGTSSPPPPIWPIRLIQIQLSLVYGVNALIKTTPHYLSGEALIGMSASMPNFLFDLSSGYLQLGLLTLPAWVLACATVLAEYFLAIGFWSTRWRMAAAVVGILFHLTLRFVVKIHMLDWVSMFLYLAFLLPFERKPNGSAALRRSSL